MANIKNLKIAILNDMRPNRGIFTYIYNIYLNLKKHDVYVDFYQYVADYSYSYDENFILRRGINFKIKKNVMQSYKQIGNSVPVPVVELIAKEVVRNLE